jgi:hypothetical protein
MVLHELINLVEQVLLLNLVLPVLILLEVVDERCHPLIRLRGLNTLLIPLRRFALARLQISFQIRLTLERLNLSLFLPH